VSSTADQEFGADSVDQVVSTLNRLIETCRDGESGFKLAAGAVDDLNLQHLLESYSQQRTEFAAELQNEVRRLGEDPVNAGHITASLHRGWMDIRSAVAGREEGPIIAECERGEDAAVKAYEEAVATPLPLDIRAVVERQFSKIKDAHDQIRSLEQIHSRHR
jgi:uncharacterized protein (TIGR02284 family)